MRRWAGALAVAVATALLALVLGGYAAGAGPLFETLANFRLHLAVAAAALTLLLGLGRLPRSALPALLAAVIAAGGLGPVFEAAERPGAGRPLTLLYANLRNGNPAPDALARALLAANADILITSETLRAVAEDAGGLSQTYPYRLVREGRGQTLRTAIWSRFPLAGGELFLNNNVAPTGATARADLGGGVSVGLIGAHFSRPFEGLHRIQAEALRAIAVRLGRPLIIAGDFNAAPWSALVARVATVTETRVLGGFRVTWKGAYETPLGRLPEPWGHQIDQILLSAEIGVESVETVQLPGSDHRGVKLRLTIPPN